MNTEHQPASLGKAHDSRKQYRKPQLMEYGQVAALTQGGGLTSIPSEDVLYYIPS